MSRRGGSTPPEGDFGARMKEVGAQERGQGTRVRCRRHKGEVEERKRQRGLSGLLSWPAPAARRVIASPGQASRVRPLLHTIPLAPLLLFAMPGARSGPSVLLLPLLLSSRSCSLYPRPPRALLGHDTHRRAARAVRFLTTAAPARVARATVHLRYAFLLSLRCAALSQIAPAYIAY